jgi:hypothetical protein
MKIKTSEMIDVALDWAVAYIIAKEENQLSALRVISSGVKPFVRLLHDGGNPNGPGRNTQFSTDWAAGGPIIERENISLFGNKAWAAAWYGPNGGEEVENYGPTPLIAAMRCYVASKLGDEVDIPQELLS